jgi:Skp family chaperone for outer membrane proteins
MLTRTNIATVAILILAMSPALMAQGTVRIGTFDSRAVAIAYGQSAAFGTEMKQLMADFQKAKQEKNEKLIAELESKGQTQQKLLHLQGFSIGSVSEILANYKDAVAAVAKEANVSAVVSQYELLYQGSGIETVDVTEALARKINGEPRIVEMLGEIKKVKPLPMIEVLGLKDEH